ncbi:DUF6248 family natural product biosynthesis protein [Streptomyces sp. Isolate_45]|uniref:DUF6248 family natural product biosynthesis protein n=1 Tax=Streptomyces sp. Isolate_45 TaxID=2950111 RepID=UPI002481B5D3|nr:DUF6248 family natural product biosynthesis protein [Streptomyces sp. Isolate_45]MDA5279875.1 DUF6248 family natural product biosynthesis protein [Streptomyces sp. Isolate_45]
MDALTLHRALHLGIVDPVATKPSSGREMSEATAAWVRGTVWPAYLRKGEEIDEGYPWGFTRWSQCERGTCWNCLNGRCDLCIHRQQGGPAVETVETDGVYFPDGRVVADLILRPDGGPCVWWCRCPCPKDGLAPEKPRRRAKAVEVEATPLPAPTDVSPPSTHAPFEPVQDGLF